MLTLSGKISNHALCMCVCKTQLLRTKEEIVMQSVLFVLKTLVVTTTPQQRQLTNKFRSQIGNGKVCVCVCVCSIMYDTHVLNLHLLYTKPRVSQSNNCVQLCVKVLVYLVISELVE